MGTGKPGFLFAMRGACFLSGCKEPEQTFLAALRHVRGHISCFFVLIKNSRDWGAGGGWRKKQTEEAGKANMLAISR